MNDAMGNAGEQSAAIQIDANVTLDEEHAADDQQTGADVLEIFEGIIHESRDAAKWNIDGNHLYGYLHK